MKMVNFQMLKETDWTKQKFFSVKAEVLCFQLIHCSLIVNCSLIINSTEWAGGVNSQASDLKQTKIQGSHIFNNYEVTN